MTPAQIAKIMALVDAHSLASYHTGTLVGVGNRPDKVEASIRRTAEHRAAVEAALRDAPQQAEGWVMVPVAPTQTMMQQGKHALYEESMGDFDASLLEIKATYRAMLAARPSAPTAVEPDERADLKAVVIQLLKHFPTDTDMMEAGWSTADIDAACNAYDLAKTVLARASKGTP